MSDGKYAVGNPVRMWEDGFDMYGYALEWEGRQLVSVSNVWDDGELDTFLEFTYNADGIRTSKTYNGVKHEYFLNGSQVIAETWTQNNVEHLLIYLYDENSSPLGLKYRNSTYSEGTFDCYFFEKNLQGDIVAVYDSTGYRIGQYIYDAWGRCTVICNSYGLDKTVVESYNPFRYRGYFYDVETKMYYLQSRYYSPDMGRFFNGDGVNVITATPMGLTDKNLYAYCDNNPVMRIDEDGEFWNTIIGTVVGAIVGGISAAISGTDITAGVVSGAISGAISGAAVDIAIATGGVGLVALAGVAFASGIGGATSSYVNQRMNEKTNDEVDWNTVVVDGIWGTIGGAISFGAADVGGEMCRTLSQNLALKGKEFLGQAGNDFVTTLVITFGTWLNGSKMNMIRDGKATVASVY